MNIKILATILAKNEEDIIGKCIEHHIKQGVSQFIVTDNNSTDRTRAIASSYKEVVIIDEPDDTHDQSKWVTRMARMACQFSPDWIVHLDADELWCGLGSLQGMKCSRAASIKMLLHPPSPSMKHYLDFSGILPDECKVMHRPDPSVTITHGNHGFLGEQPVFTQSVWRHHYPIRSLSQFIRKSNGHEALARRGAVCERWKKWHGSDHAAVYEEICAAWERMVSGPNWEDLRVLLGFWSTQEAIEQVVKGQVLPRIGKWPSE